MNTRRFRHIFQYRRRKEGRTNYQLRKKLVLSDNPLFTVRTSNRYLYVNIATPEPDGDKTVTSANSKELIEKFGLVSAKNIPAAYLTGLLAGIRAKKKNIKRAILNLGPAWTTKASIPFATVHGALDAGLDIPLGSEAFVSPERIRGEHIASYADMLEESQLDTYRRRFSKYLEAGFDPKVLPMRVDEIKEKLLKEVE